MSIQNRATIVVGTFSVSSRFLMVVIVQHFINHSAVATRTSLILRMVAHFLPTRVRPSASATVQLHLPTMSSKLSMRMTAATSLLAMRVKPSTRAVTADGKPPIIIPSATAVLPTTSPSICFRAVPTTAHLPIRER